MPDEINLTDEQKQAVEKGKRLGFLVAALDISDEEREQLLALMSEMNEEQLAAMVKALEENYLAHAGAEADAELKRGLENVALDYANKMRAAQKTADDKLNELAKELE